MIGSGAGENPVHCRGILCVAQLLHEHSVPHRPRDGRQCRQMLIAAVRLGQQQDNKIDRPFVDRRKVDWPRQSDE